MKPIKIISETKKAKSERNDESQPMKNENRRNISQTKRENGNENERSRNWRKNRRKSGNESNEIANIQKRKEKKNEK